MASIAELATKGRENYAAKIPQMVKDYASSIGRQNANYRAVGFGPRMSGNYEASASRRTAHYTQAVLNAEKWYNNWIAAAQE